MWLPVKINGDLVLLKGIMKEMLAEEEKKPGSIFDHDFIRRYTAGYDDLIQSLHSASWEQIVSVSGLSREQIRHTAEMAMRSKATICCWAMGLTQHKNAVETIREVLNFMLLRGNIGRPGAVLAVVTPALDLRNHLTQGVLWGVISGFADALLSLLSRSCVRSFPALSVTFYQQAFAALFVSPALLGSRAALSPRALLLLLVLGVIFTALAQVLFVGSLRHIRAQMASVIIGLEPVYGILFALVLVGEVPSGRTVLGGLLICGAALATTLKHLNVSAG